MAIRVKSYYVRADREEYGTKRGGKTIATLEPDKKELGANVQYLRRVRIHYKREKRGRRRPEGRENTCVNLGWSQGRGACVSRRTEKKKDLNPRSEGKQSERHFQTRTFEVGNTSTVPVEKGGREGRVTIREPLMKTSEEEKISTD